MIKTSKEEDFLYQILSSIETGDLRVINHLGETYQFGKCGSSPKLCLHFKNSDAYKHIFALGSLGVGESYMNGWWEEENNNIVDLMGLLLTSGVYSKARGQLVLILKIITQRLLTLPMIIKNSRQNVQHHYDIGNSFYQLFLDKTLTYSCGYQLCKTDTLEVMQKQKYELVCKKLNLQPGNHLIDIGCGWGGMLIYAAENYGISGTGITLSAEQAEFAEQQITQKGLSSKLRVTVSDYREIEGQYDKFVSIGMFEHVGRANFSTFMQKTSDLLKPGGIGLLHTIGTIGQVRNDPWVAKYIFPGGYLPKLHELVQEMLAARLMISHCENLKPHYAETLQKWSENFRNNQEQVAALGASFDEKFIRMWDYYLQSFEAGFRYSNLQLYQVLFCKGKQWSFSHPLLFSVSATHEEYYKNNSSRTYAE